jgi:hypothetical protein
MNRQDRRALESIHKKDMQRNPLKPARQDGRPLYFDIEKGQTGSCYHCEKEGNRAQHGYGQAFIADPANSPDGSNDLFTICYAHLPENAVIWNQHSDFCRNKLDTERWREG